MPVTFKVAEHPAQPVPSSSKLSPQAFVAEIRKGVDQTLPKGHAEATRLVSSSLRPAATARMSPAKNGFVYACVDAYNHHHHLVVRPDDIWLAICAQLGVYIQGHPDEVKELVVRRRKRIRFVADSHRWRTAYRQMTRFVRSCMEDNLVDKDLSRWIIPDFTTTTQVDALCAAVMMIGKLQSHFVVDQMPLCGIPTVTLQGEQSDYIKILERIDRLAEFGPETAVWGEMLHPILRRFISAFDGEPDEPFWHSVCHQTSEMCGDEYYTGWITAFCPFNDKGQWQLFTPRLPEHVPHLQVDSIVYQAVHVDKIPWGFAQVDVKIVEGGVTTDAVFVAGLVATKVSDGPVSGSQSVLGLQVNTAISAQPAWFIYENIPPVASPTRVPQELQSLHHFLHNFDSNSYLTSGVPLWAESAFNPPSAAFGPQEPPRSARTDYSVRFAEIADVHSSTETDPQEGPRKLRKFRPNTMVGEPKESKSWRFPGRRLPLTTSNGA